MLHDCSARSRDGHFTIPDDLLVGLYLSYGQDGNFTDPGGFYIGGLISYRSGMTLTIHYQGLNGSSIVKVAETSMTFDSSRKNVVALLGYEKHFFSGTLVLGDIKGLANQPAGEWEFSHDATAIDPFCVRPMAAELSALYVQDHGKTVGPFHGNVTLSAGDRIGLTVRSADSLLKCLEEPPVGTGTEVIIEAFETTTTSTQGQGETRTTGLQTVNGIEPDENGNITLIGRSCLDIVGQSDQATIVFDDHCAEPCCTCKELTPVEEQIEQLTQSIASLETHIETLALQAEFLAQSIASVSP